jgi:hypothetical protein
MVRDGHDAVGDKDERAPRMLRQPADAPPPVPPVAASDAVRSFRRTWSSWSSHTGYSLRAWAGRVSGRSDRRLLRSLAEATDAIASQCDLLADRVAARDAVGADVADTFGEEVARLRAEVLHLTRLVGSPSEPPP